jgi:hypothetical protein
MADSFNMSNLLGVRPDSMLLVYGPSKLLLDHYHWHEPQIGIVASYTPKPADVHDHFGLFRGVDQIEAFAQATIGSCSTFLLCEKLGCTPTELKRRFLPAFISIGAVNFHDYLAEGEIFVSVGKIKVFKFRQMVCDGRIYKVTGGIELNEYFSDFTESRLDNYELSGDFKLVAELFDITGRAFKKESFITNN